MTELARERNDVCLLSGDIGNRMFDRYKEVAPTRFMNCGIAEANMMSMAAGMALSGLRPVVYTITPFTTTRCLEQIRIGIAYHEAPVVIVGTGSGLSYSELGTTHHSLEDIAILRSIPNIQVCAPSDPLELVAQLRQAIDEGKPTYIRIGKKGEKNLFSEKAKLGIGRSQLIKPGKNVLLLGVGPILNEALKAKESLMQHGIDLAIASMGGIKPIDNNFLHNMVKENYTRWISLEEHYKIGGLGSRLLEWLSEQEIKDISLTRLGIDDFFINELGNQDYVRRVQGIDAKGIEDAVKNL